MQETASEAPERSNQREIIMKKFIIAVAALTVLSTASFADQNSENANAMEKKRMEFFITTDKMLTDQMAMLKHQEEMLTAYQALLKQMMENENSGN
jgi:hypothetical protein